MIPKEDIYNSYNLLIETMESTVGIVREFKDTAVKDIEIHIQIGIIGNVIESCKRLKDDLVKIAKENDPKKGLS